MSDLILALFSLVAFIVAIVIVIWVTVLAVRSVRRGEKPWNAFKTWLVQVIDALFGIG